MTRVHITPSALERIALGQYQQHAEHCPWCEPASIDRSQAACNTGRRLELAWAGRWQQTVQALSGSR